MPTLFTWLHRLLHGRARASGPAVTTPATSPAPAPPPVSLNDTKPPSTLDPRTERNIATLHPRVQPRAREFMVLASEITRPHGVTVKIISGLRSYAEQSALYAKGRTAPGPKVTNARAGFSNHNFGTAWDIGLFKNKRYLTASPLYTKIGQAARSLGIVWGGDFKSFKDTPHYEIPTGHTLAQMRQRVAAKKDIFV